MLHRLDRKKTKIQKHKHINNHKKTKVKTKLKRKLKTKKITGGNVSKFLKSGSYGCVYRPPIDCESECKEKRCLDGISKYMNQSKSKNEADKFDELGLNRIDPLHQYHIQKPHQCKPSSNFEINSTKCKVAVKTPSLLIYDDGGKDLEDYLTMSNNPVNILDNLEQILKFILIMIKNKVVHFDIKKANIVTGKNGNDFKLIDFGLGVNYKIKFNFNDIFKAVYNPWMISIIFCTKENPKDVNNKILIEHIKKFTQLKNIHPNLKNIDLLPILQNVRGKLISKAQKIDDILDKVDLYSFAMILYNYLKPLKEYKKIIDEFIENTQIFNPNPFLIKSPDSIYNEYQILKDNVKKIRIKTKEMENKYINNQNLFML
jgi:serine/threonine protein kinase